MHPGGGAYGDEKAAGEAKNTMKYAIMGLVVALSGLIVINLVDYLLT